MNYSNTPVPVNTEHLKKIAQEKVDHYDNLIKKQGDISPFHQQVREISILTLELIRNHEESIRSLRLYGNKSNFTSITDGSKQYSVIIDSDTEYLYSNDNHPIKTGGKLARLTLQRLGITL